jgi:NADH dehydrogenase
MAWAWDYFDRDHAATVEASSAPQRIVWGGDDEDLPHISLERPKSDLGGDEPERGDENA